MFPKIPASKKSLSSRKPISGVGTNDADYMTQLNLNGKTLLCPIYSRWSSMIKRVYSEKLLKKRPKYRSVSVCDEWLVFSNFANWYSNNYVEGFELDKDIKVKGNNIYSPDTCMFVPPEINLLMTNNKITSDLPPGVSFENRRNKYVARVSVNGVQKFLCYKLTAEEAFYEYKIAKNIEIRRKMKQFPEFSKYLEQHLYEV